jgi:hypothetical protein
MPDEDVENKDNLTVLPLAPAILIALDDINISLQKIYSKLSEHDDDGDYLFQQGTATTDLSQNIIDLLGTPGYPVKGYVINNNGKNTIELGHNITPSIIDSNLTTVTGKFYPLFAGETHKEMFNRKVIRNIYIRTDIGTSTYRLWLLW